MTSIDLNDLHKIGVIQDVSAHMLPPEAWTTGLNVYSKNKAVNALPGWSQVFGTPLIAPHFAYPLMTAAQTFWLYTSLVAAAVWDGTSHTSITRAAGAYTADETRRWSGTIIGGIPVLNNGLDVPQYWSPPTVATALQNLTNWPATLRATIVRAFGAYLIAFNITDAGSNFPHLVKWSSQVSGPGTLPGSWDETDEAVDTGEYDLPDVNSGIIQEAATLASKMFVYKDNSIWSMRFVGGRAVFAFETFSETMGILAPRCVAVTGDGKKHVLATQDDIVIHDGVSAPVSLIDERRRSSLFSDIDPTNFVNSFMFSDPENNLIAFCYPQNGQTQPNRALIINYKDGSLFDMDGVDFRNAIAGRVEASDSETFDGSSGSFDTDSGPFSLSERRRLILSNPDDSKLHKWASGFQRDGVDYSCTLQRTGLAIVGRKRSGEWIVDHEIMKFVDRLQPKIKGAALVKIRLGFQEFASDDSPVTWTPYFDFVPGTDVFADLTVSGRAVAVEFFLPTASEFRLDGYKMSVTAEGEH